MLGYEEILKRREVWRIIEAMPEVHRRCLKMKYVKRYTAKEIAEELGKTPYAVNNIIHKAKGKIKNEIKKATTD